MKFHSIFICIISLSLNGYSQNLVPNPSFENYTLCPDSIHSSNLAIPWVDPNNRTSDYYNQCGSSNWSTPQNDKGNQPARTGVAYAGLHISSSTSDFAKEYIGVQLTSPLVVNECYHFEMFVSAADYYLYTSDNIGVYFSAAYVFIPYSYYYSFTPQIKNTPGNYFSFTSWTMVSGDYIAAGGEQYIVIGSFDHFWNINFAPNPNPISGALQHCDVFIDDVSLISCTVLPIELLNFSAIKSKSSVELLWTTASETNNDYFSVERSSDAENFSELKKVNGAGNSTVKLDYSCTDEKPVHGISYYRLKQVDYDGAFSYSETIQINFSNSKNDIDIFPNPCFQQTMLYLPDDLNGETKVKVYDSQGKLIQIKSEYNITSRYLLNFGNLEKGVYYISVENNYQVYKKTMIVL